MQTTQTKQFQAMFASRLDTLAHLLSRAEAAFGREGSFLDRRIAPDMFPFGTQVAFTCNQPRNFALWCKGEPANNLDPNVTSVQQARTYIDDTRALLLSVSGDDAKLAAMTRIDLGPEIYAEVTGAGYINDFLIPNFYFHLVTAYDILRMSGVDLGKRDYMGHLLPFVRQK